MFKGLLGSLITLAVIIPSLASANGSSYQEGFQTHEISDNGAGFYIGGQFGGGYTHWGNIEGVGIAPNFNVSRDNGFAGRIYGGYAFNRYFAVEGGWTYLPSNVRIKARADISSKTKIKNWAADISGLLSVPLQDQFGLFATAGLGYFYSLDAPNLADSSGSFVAEKIQRSWNVTWGGGIYFDFFKYIRVTASWRRIEGHAKVDDKYQPDPDLFLVGLQFRIPVDLFSASKI